MVLNAAFRTPGCFVLTLCLTKPSDLLSFEIGIKSNTEILGRRLSKTWLCVIYAVLVEVFALVICQTWNVSYLLLLGLKE